MILDLRVTSYETFLCIDANLIQRDLYSTILFKKVQDSVVANKVCALFFFLGRLWIIFNVRTSVMLFSFT